MLPDPAALPKLPLFADSSVGQLNRIQNQLATTTTSGLACPDSHPLGSGALKSSYNPTAVLPPKLVKRIMALEFVKMVELLPDTWPSENLSLEQGQTQRRAH